MDYTIQAIEMRDFFDLQAEWSQATFGKDSERGPTGALKHLGKEVKEALEATTPEERNKEIVDCLFLVFDAARRAGFTYGSLAKAAKEKLEVNKQRTWPTPISDEPVEHVRDE